MFRAFKSINTQYPELDRVQDFIAQAINPLLDSPIADGVLVELRYNGTTPVISSGSDTNISHGLNRPIRGWFVVRTKTNATVYESTTVSPNPNTILVLRSSSNITADISLWVF